MGYDWRKEAAFEESLKKASSLAELKTLWDARVESGEDSNVGELQCNLARIISQAISIVIQEPLIRPTKWCSEGVVIQDVDGWLKLTYTLDFSKAISKAIRLFNKSAELGYQAGCYYLSRLAGVLEEHYSSWNVDYDADEQIPPEVSLYWKYKKLHDETWKQALSMGEPHALYEESLNDYDIHFNEKERAAMLKRAAVMGHPLAVIEYAFELRDVDPQKACQMMESVSWSRRAQSLKAMHYREERDEVDNEHKDYLDDEPEPSLSDYYDDLAELELNTRGDGFD